MLYLIKRKNIFDIFCKNIYTIKYHKCDFFNKYFLLFFHSIDQFLEIFQINKVICIKLSILKSNLIRKFTKIITLVILYGLYKNINSYLFYINNV